MSVAQVNSNSLAPVDHVSGSGGLAGAIVAIGPVFTTVVLA